MGDTHTPKISEESHSLNEGLTGTKGGEKPTHKQLKNTLLNMIANKDYRFNGAMTRKFNGAFKAISPDCIPATQIKKMAQNVEVKFKDITQTDIKTALKDSSTLKLFDNEGKGHLMFVDEIQTAGNNHKLIRNTIELLFDARMTMMKESASIKSTGAFALQLKDMGIEEEVIASFNMANTDLVRVVEVNPDDYDMVEFDGGYTGDQRHIMKVKTYGSDEGYSHLSVNAMTLKNINILVPQFYCGKSNGGCSRNSGSDQIRKNKLGTNCCPSCGQPKRFLSPQSVQIDLPFIVDGKLRRTAIGKVDFRAIRLNKRKSTALINARNNHTDGHDFITMLMRETGQKHRISVKGKTIWVGCEIKPVVFDIVNRNLTYLGLALVPKESSVQVSNY